MQLEVFDYVADLLAVEPHALAGHNLRLLRQRGTRDGESKLSEIVDDRFAGIPSAA